MQHFDTHNHGQGGKQPQVAYQYALGGVDESAHDYERMCYNRQLWAEPDQTDKDGYDNALVRSHSGGELTLSRTVTTETVSVG